MKSTYLLSLIYVLPALLIAPYFTHDGINPVPAVISTVGVIALTILILAGALIHIKTTGEETKTYIEVLAVFTGLLLAAELFFGITATGQPQTILSLALIHIPFWPTLLYTIIIAAPILTAYIKKSTAKRNLAADLSSVFTFWGILFLILYGIRSVLGDANDIITPGADTPLFMTLATVGINTGLVLWAALGIAAGTAMLVSLVRGRACGE